MKKFLSLILFLGTLFSCNGGTKESKEIIEELNKMTEDDLKVTKIKSITLKNKEK